MLSDVRAAFLTSLRSLEFFWFEDSQSLPNCRNLTGIHTIYVGSSEKHTELKGTAVQSLPTNSIGNKEVRPFKTREQRVKSAGKLATPFTLIGFLFSVCWLMEAIFLKPCQVCLRSPLLDQASILSPSIDYINSLSFLISLHNVLETAFLLKGLSVQ